MNILLVEDEPRLAAFIKKGLSEEGHVVDVAGDGVTALSLAHVGTYDVIVLDVMLPGKNGFQITAELRAAGNATPILMLTVRDAREDIIRGLDVGADDYLTKPFDFGELLARVRALGRRSQPIQQGVLRFADIELDRLQHEVRRGGELIRLTPTEFRLLEALMLVPGRVVRRTELLDRVWGMGFDPGTGLIDVHVAHLRKKLEAGGRPRVIATVKGVGFRLREPGAA
ncbi:MAG: DNA-binding response regulator [Gemmatimonadales bacterium]|nr:MAG: DNA-binding response regulator [Gemmatimonadales bacterium]